MQRWRDEFNGYLKKNRGTWCRERNGMVGMIGIGGIGGMYGYGNGCEGGGIEWV